MPTLLKYSSYCFSRNPIILDLSTAYWADLCYKTKGVPYSVSIGGVEVYKGRFFPPCRIDISDVVNANIMCFDEPHDLNSPICNIISNGAWDNYEVNVHIGTDGIEEDVEFFAVPGGVSRQNLRIYSRSNTDAFAARFIRPAGNFFLTSRTSGWRIVIKETELAPLYFIRVTDSDDMAARNPSTGTTIKLGVVDGGLNTLNIDAMRRKFFDEKGELPSVFDILCNHAVSCQIVIQHADVATDRYRLKFRNALGVFEIVELPCEVALEPATDTSDDDICRLYDPTVGGFTNYRKDIERSTTLTVDTVVKGRAELEYLLGAIYSEEVYLLDYANYPLKVIPSIDTLSYPHRITAPLRITVRLLLTDTELLATPDIANTHEAIKPRIFSEQFSEQFN